MRTLRALIAAAMLVVRAGCPGSSAGAPKPADKPADGG